MTSSGHPLPLPFPPGIPPWSATNGGGDSGLIEVVPVPILTDNIAYLLVDGTAAAAVDPAVPAKMVRAAIDRGVAITAVLTTHKHWEYGRCMYLGSRGGVRGCAGGREGAGVNRAQRGVVLTWEPALEGAPSVVSAGCGVHHGGDPALPRALRAVAGCEHAR